MHVVYPAFFNTWAKVRRLGVQQPKANVIAVVVNAGHDLHARRRANRLRMTMRKPQPAPGHLIQHRRRITGPPIGPNALVADVVGKYEYDIRYTPFLGASACFAMGY